MVLRYFGLLFTATLVCAQDTGLDQPLGLIIDGQLTRVAEKGRWTPSVTSGTEIFAGDILRNDSTATTTIAFCAARGVFEVPPSAAVNLSATELSRNPPVRRVRDLPACSLPKVHRTPLPGTE